VIANWLSDIDVFGSNGDNCGVIPTASGDYEIWKIDPGFIGFGANTTNIGKFIFYCPKQGLLFDKLHVKHQKSVISMISTIIQFSDEKIEQLVNLASTIPPNAPQVVKNGMAKVGSQMISSLINQRNHFQRVYKKN